MRDHVFLSLHSYPSGIYIPLILMDFGRKAYHMCFSPKDTSSFIVYSRAVPLHTLLVFQVYLLGIFISSTFLNTLSLPFFSHAQTTVTFCLIFPSISQTTSSLKANVLYFPLPHGDYPFFPCLPLRFTPPFPSSVMGTQTDR